MNATAARPKLHPGDDDPSLTAHAGLALVGELVARIGLVEGIDARLGHLKARRRGLSPGQFVVSMAESVLAGGSHLSDVEALRADEAGACLRAVANPPAPSTAGQLFSRFKITDCWKLERASAEAANGLDKALGLKPGTITLDADSTTCRTFGAKKKGTGWSHGGVRGYQPFVISWAERRRFLAADLLAANNNPVASSPRLLRRALTLLPDGADGVRLRGDSGFYSADLMAECAKKGVRFSICAKRTTVVWAEMLSIPKGAWRRAKDMRRAQVAETTHEVAGVGTCRLILPRKLKDRVTRSLSGKALTPETLNWFIEAFSMLRADRERLWALLEDSEQIRVITGEVPIVSADLGSPKHETSLLHEFHSIGPDGLSYGHRTVQVTRSLVDGLAGYPYRFDTNAVTVEVLRGGRVGPLYKIADTLYAVDILFTRPLQVGETASMEYRTTFH